MAEAIDGEIHMEMPNKDLNEPPAEEVTIPVFMEENFPLFVKKIVLKQRPTPQNLLPDCCRVPTTLRYLKEEAYTPKVISIGPLHHGNERLQDMEKHKQIMFKRFTQRAGSSMDGLSDFVRLLSVPKVHTSYPETIDLTDTPKLVNMILLDAGFIIELFIMCHEMEDANDAKLSQPWLKNSIMHDLLLLENQLPFFVIEDLFKRVFPGIDTSFLELTYEYFGYYNHQRLKPNPDIVRIKHFTDLLRLFYLLEEMPQRCNLSAREGFNDVLLYNANALQEAGIKLKATKSKYLLDLKFSGHNRLEIPKILVEDVTELVFRNMIALEQCHYPYTAYITDYAIILDWLTNTSKDVDLLVEKEIVRHYLGDSHSVASLFNGLGKNVILTNFNSEYFEMNQRLNGYCEDPWNKMKATLRRDYCNTPWRTVASIAGIIILGLTIVQTIFSVLQVVFQ